MKIILAIIGITLCLLMCVLIHDVRLLEQTYTDILISIEQNTVEYNHIKHILAERFCVEVD